MKFSAYALLLLVVVCLWSDCGAKNARFCGKRLIRVLKKLCRHQYRISTRELRPSHQPHRRSGPGIVDECCLQTCTFSTLKSYCDTEEEWELTTTKSVEEKRADSDQRKLPSFMKVVASVGDVFQNRN